jgi:hypothetical protein
MEGDKDARKAVVAALKKIDPSIKIKEDDD